MIDEQNPLQSSSLSPEDTAAPGGTAHQTSDTPQDQVESSVDYDTPGEDKAQGVDSPSVFDALELESESGINITDKLAEEVDTLRQQLKALQDQLDQRNEQYVRIAADFENFRKRIQRDKEDSEQQVRAATLLELLPVLDTFERAKDQLKPESDEAQKIHTSYQGVYKQFLDCLKRVGVLPMQSEGQEFDPALHNAIMREPTDQYPEGVVIQEFQPGYLLGERVLRHAMVKVAAALDSSSGASEDGETIA